VTLADGSVHGTLCSASSEPKTSLGDEELEFMRVLSGIVARRIERAREFAARLDGQSPNA
jgi:GAF domain-containing protein